MERSVSRSNTTRISGRSNVKHIKCGQEEDMWGEKKNWRVTSGS
jgi:hypothetical protein